MPLKGQSPKEVVHTEMHKFKHGSLHSGSKHGPLVKSRRQAIAIALSESGQSKKADGGRTALDIAFAEKRRARAEGGKVFEGPIVSEVPGRTDHHDMDVASGSYVLPSSHVASLGEDNTLAGMNHLKQIGPHGIRKLAYGAKGARDIVSKHRLKRALGGAADDNTGHPIGIQAAGGEHVMSPDDVRIVGDGDVTLGHKLLDNWVIQNRKHHIKTLSNLAPPAKD